MNWEIFSWFAIPAVICWSSSAMVALFSNKKILASILNVFAILILGAFIVGVWFSFGRPPIKTMGETRLLYAFFLSIVGLWASISWGYFWLLGFTCLLSSIFVLTNLINPEVPYATIMPALQSNWFIPHVTVYILSYAMLGVSAIAAVRQIFYAKVGYQEKLQEFIDIVAYRGLGFLLLGLLSGALWAKEAWGDYWSWDPKETWAFITACGFLIYVHIRRKKYLNNLVLFILPISCVLLFIAWIGVSYLPSAQVSIHVY